MNLARKPYLLPPLLRMPLRGLPLFFFGLLMPLRLTPGAENGPLVMMDVYSKPSAPSDIRYHGHSAKDGVLTLTASNGFFDRCFEAVDPQLRAEPDPFIGLEFGALARLSDAVPGTARWHLWFAEAGEWRASFSMTVPLAEAGQEWMVRAGGEVRVLKSNPCDGKSPQEQALAFHLKEPRLVTLEIDFTKSPPPRETKLHTITLSGPAAAKASVLRTRWRPAAVHARFVAPNDCPLPNLWVFETQSVSKTSSYSPLTTDFGYYGTSFNAEGRIAKGAGFNFSMWLAERNGVKAPPIERMPRLIGTDLPDAEFSTFGHEGTGVKFRDAVAYPDGADRTIQAMRIEATNDGRLNYYGYFYDERQHGWKLYASAQNTPKRVAAAKSPSFGVLNSTGSFCEIPGPPNRERSGDIVRDIKRRGWFHGSDGKWYRARLSDEASKAKPSSVPTNQGSFPSDDFAREGWMRMTTGGIEYRVKAAALQETMAKDEATALPDYLDPEKTAQLFHLPVEFGPAAASQTTADSATVDCEIRKTGPNSKGILYYGTVDCATYPPRRVTKGSAVEIDMFRPERTWPFATPEQPVYAGANRFKLIGLLPATTYHFRLFVTHDEGKSWAYESGSFRTKD